MGFFQTIKNKLGIGGVSVELQVPGQVPKSSDRLACKTIITSKSDQYLVRLDAKLIEEWTTGRGDDKKTKEIFIDSYSIQFEEEIKTGERKEVEFSISLENLNKIKSNNQELADKGGALGALGKLGSFANNEKSEFFVVVDVDVKSAALDPSDKKPVKFI
ncbi:MAG TPA: sporulation protein [Chitinophagales bacterium]|nr:sporulation protein [Chitinophagales bacterium]